MKRIKQIIALAGGILSMLEGFGQCNNTTYAVSYNGIISSVNTTTGALTTVGTIPYSVNNANALAYAPKVGSTPPAFYFFSNSNAGSLVFQSYTPSTGVFTTLTTFNGPTGTVNSACISPDYKGYYCLDSYGYLYYYDIGAKKWNLITNVIKDQTGANITSTVASYSSGDMAFDGNKTLWLLLANQTTSKYGLYKLPNAPKNNVASVTIQKVIPLSTSMPDGNDPVGITFGVGGEIYITTLNMTNFTGNLYVWYGTQSIQVKIGSESSVLLDLSSCSLPAEVLPVHFVTFTALPTKGSVEVHWQVAQQNNVKEYTIERSQDGVQWQSIGNITPSSGTSSKYSFTDNHPYNTRSYYRISEIDWNAKVFYSSTATVQLTNIPSLRSWPNPASDILNVENPFSFPIKANVFDAAGRMILGKTLQPGTNQINTLGLRPGIYVLHTSLPQESMSLTFVKSSTNN